MFMNIIRRHALWAAMFAVGVGLSFPMVHVASYEDNQTKAFDVGVKLLSGKPVDADNATRAFQASINIYKNQLGSRTWFDRLTLPVPNQELVALAYFNLGNIMSASGAEPKDILAAYLTSLRYNSGQGLIPGATAGDDKLHQYAQDFCVAPTNIGAMTGPAPSSADCVLLRLQKEAQDTRNNIQALVDQHPELKKMLKEGPGDGDGQGNQPAKGQPKGQAPGQGQPGSTGFTHNNPKAI